MYASTAAILSLPLLSLANAAPSSHSSSAEIIGLAYGPDHTTVVHEVEVLPADTQLPAVDVSSCCKTSGAAISDRASPGQLEIVAAEPEFENETDVSSPDAQWKVYAKLQLTDSQHYYTASSNPVETVQVTVNSSTIYACADCTTDNYNWFDALFLIHNVTATALPGSSSVLTTPFISVKYTWALNENGDAYTPTIYAASCGQAKEDPNAAYIQAPGLCWNPSKVVLADTAKTSNYSAHNSTPASTTTAPHSGAGHRASGYLVPAVIAAAALLL